MNKLFVLLALLTLSAVFMLPALGHVADARAAWARAAEGARAVVLDATDEAQMAMLGQLLWEEAGRIPFAVGSQGVEMALVAHWRAAGLLP